MSDFFREVDEDYRRDRLVQIWTRYQWWLIAAAVLLVAATAGWRVYQHIRAETAEAASAQYEAALQLSADGKSAEAEAAFEALAKTGPKGYATLARLRAVDEIAGRDPLAAIAGYDSLVAAPNYDPAFKDMAQTRAAILLVDSDDPKAFEQKFGPLAAQGFTYHNSIRELLALSAFRRQDFEAAGRWLDMIASDPRAPSALRQRAEAFLGLVQAGKAPPPASAAPEKTAADPAAPAEPAPPPADKAPAGEAPAK
ncbi:MAG: tetratricopeptide repeat protein [Methylocella sp.]